MVPPRQAAGYKNQKAPWNGALRWGRDRTPMIIRIVA
jgi:hypothetical protein